ncbi:unnamed protein product, partial [marine sediment metagenome]
RIYDLMSNQTAKSISHAISFGSPSVRRAKQGYFRLIGQTAAGRYLTVFVASRGRGVYGLVTARNATATERRQYQAQRGR